MIDILPSYSASVRRLDSKTDPITLADGRYVVRVEAGKIVSSAPMLDGLCVVDPNNQTQLATMLRECVHPSLLTGVMERLQ